MDEDIRALERRAREDGEARAELTRQRLARGVGRVFIWIEDSESLELPPEPPLPGAVQVVIDGWSVLASPAGPRRWLQGSPGWAWAVLDLDEAVAPPSWGRDWMEAALVDLASGSGLPVAGRIGGISVRRDEDPRRGPLRANPFAPWLGAIQFVREQAKKSAPSGQLRGAWDAAGTLWSHYPEQMVAVVRDGGVRTAGDLATRMLCIPEGVVGRETAGKIREFASEITDDPGTRAWVDCLLDAARRRDPAVGKEH